MMTKWFSILAIAVVGLWTPVRAAVSGDIMVRDDAGVFSADGIYKAEQAFRGTSFPTKTQLTVVTYPDVPESKKADLRAIKDDRAARARFFRDWARDVAKIEHDRGIFIMIVMGEGHNVEVLADRETDVSRGFTEEKVRQVQGILAKAFGSARSKDGDEAKAIRDKGLLEATEYVAAELKNAPTRTANKPVGSGQEALPSLDFGGSNLGSLLCLGFVGLLGAWLVIGLIRGLSGGMGGPGGFGGGGFLSSLFGGLFGAAAGMYLYDQFFGSGSSAAAASGADGAGYDGGTAADTGAGDWDNGTSAGGDFGGGDFGGGDFGGGDFGGGDFGGGDW